MKIYLCGAHGSGKSTLCRYISKQYNLSMLNEVARMVLAERELHFDTLRSDIDVVNSYQNEVFKRQIQEEAKHKNFVSDRSLIDCLAYSAQHAKIISTLMQTLDFSNYLNLLHKSDVLLFFIRPSKAILKNDGVRETVNWDGVVAIDAQIKLLLELYNVRYFQINTDSMQERVNIINSVISIMK